MLLWRLQQEVGLLVIAPAYSKLAFRPDRLLPTPMAPDVGLFLDECYSGAYNKRWGSALG